MTLQPIDKKQKGEHTKLQQTFQQQGHQRVRLNGGIIDLNQSKHLLNHIIDPKKKNNIEVIVDRLTPSVENKQRLVESLETASNISNGIIYILDYKNPENILDIFSTKHSCPHCGYSITELEPKLFSFNSPVGACPACDGLGVREFFDPQKL